jgi:hypothetical protein
MHWCRLAQAAVAKHLASCMTAIHCCYRCRQLRKALSANREHHTPRAQLLDRRHSLANTSSMIPKFITHAKIFFPLLIAQDKYLLQLKPKQNQSKPSSIALP